MKNIHILPTDISRLHLCYDITWYISNEAFSQLDTSNYKSFHIYVTNDEEIKDGDWYFDGTDLVHKKTKYNYALVYRNKKAKKIILTTDQDLIKDGIQKIDDKFLEWFVKNPICDEIEIEKRKLLQGTIFYKIIIPKEELNSIEEEVECNASQERRYSEEEVLILLRKRDKHTMNKGLIGKWLNPKDWFNKIKKK